MKQNTQVLTQSMDVSKSHQPRHIQFYTSKNLFESLLDLLLIPTSYRAFLNILPDPEIEASKSFNYFHHGLDMYSSDRL